MIRTLKFLWNAHKVLVELDHAYRSLTQVGNAINDLFVTVRNNPENLKEALNALLTRYNNLVQEFDDITGFV